MAADRVITCTNQDGDSVTFRETGFSPFLLVSAEGVYDDKNNVYLMENGVTSGAIYQGSTTPARNIVLTVKDRVIPRSLVQDADVYITNATLKDGNLNIIEAIVPEDDDETMYISSAIIKDGEIEILEANPPKRSTESKDFVEHRSLLDKVFKSGELGQLIFLEYNQRRAIDYYVESVTSTGTHSNRLHTISLICPDPFFYNPEEQIYTIGDFMPHFKFFHEFLEAGEEFGYYLANYENIRNESANDHIGMTISLSGSAQIVNPVFSRLESGQYIKIGTDETPFTLEAGETLIITTGIGNKHVYLISGGVTTEINYKMASGSTFIQLMRGNNNIYFDATSGKKAAKIQVSYKMQYARA